MLVHALTCVKFKSSCTVVKCTTFLTGNPCTGGKIYRQCGPVCPETCDSSTACNSNGCAEGCFCPDGQVENSDGSCVDHKDCFRKYFK